MATGNRNDPFTAMNFLVEIDGVEIAAFSECSGLTIEAEVIEYRNGNDLGGPRKLPGLKKYSNIILKRGVTSDRSLWIWFKQVLDGQIERRSGQVVLLNEDREPVMRWIFTEGWPVKLEGPTFDANTSAVAIESLEIAIERLQLD